jgi:uncharacterized protein YegP (UPF0339 family)
MNNYIRILVFLREFAGDTNFHIIHDFLNDIGLIDNSKKKTILSELSSLGLLKYDGGRKGGQIILGSREGKTKTFGDFWDKKYEAKITIEGLKYLKEELEMEKQGSYNFKIEGSNNQVVIDSKNVTIKAKDEVETLIQSVIKSIEADNTIQLETKDIYKRTFYKLRTEVSQDKLNQDTLKEAITIGDSVSSIGSFVLSIVNQLLIGQS